MSKIEMSLRQSTLVGGLRHGLTLDAPNDCHTIKVAIDGASLLADGGVEGSALLYERGEADQFVYRGVLNDPDTPTDEDGAG